MINRCRHLFFPCYITHRQIPEQKKKKEHRAQVKVKNTHVTGIFLLRHISSVRGEARRKRVCPISHGFGRRLKVGQSNNCGCTQTNQGRSRADDEDTMRITVAVHFAPRPLVASILL